MVFLFPQNLLMNLSLLPKNLLMNLADPSPKNLLMDFPPPPLLSMCGCAPRACSWKLALALLLTLALLLALAPRSPR